MINYQYSTYGLLYNNFSEFVHISTNTTPIKKTTPDNTQTGTKKFINTFNSQIIEVKMNSNIFVLYLFGG